MSSDSLLAKAGAGLSTRETFLVHSRAKRTTREEYVVNVRGVRCQPDVEVRARLRSRPGDTLSVERSTSSTPVCVGSDMHRTPSDIVTVAAV